MEQVSANIDQYSKVYCKDHENSHISIIGGGETVEVTFKAPDPEKPGKYEYTCTFPGHYAGGMKGTLIVQD